MTLTRPPMAYSRPLATETVRWSRGVGMGASLFPGVGFRIVHFVGIGVSQPEQTFERAAHRVDFAVDDSHRQRAAFRRHGRLLRPFIFSRIVGVNGSHRRPHARGKSADHINFAVRRNRRGVVPGSGQGRGFRPALCFRIVHLDLIADAVGGEAADEINLVLMVDYRHFGAGGGRRRQKFPVARFFASVDAGDRTNANRMKLNCLMEKRMCATPFE